MQEIDFQWQRLYHFTMRVAIDKLGRIVVPKPIRDRYHLYPGAELELEPEANGIQLSPVAPKGTLVRKQGVLVHHGSTGVDFDIAAYINTERESRLGYMVAEDPGNNLEHYRAICPSQILVSAP